MNEISRRKRVKHRAQKGQCYYCTRQMVLVSGQQRGKFNAHGGLLCTLEHRTARMRGGAGLAHNCVAACYRCNVAKGSMSEVVFILTSPHVRPQPSWRQFPERLAA